MGGLTTGYRGRRLPERRIGADLPRRAVIVGSFDWIAKRMNLEEFVDVADPLFAEKGVELQAIGSADETFLDRLRGKTVATDFTGTVPDVGRYMDEARIAIVPERSGGGFQAKKLFFVFHPIPPFSLFRSFSPRPPLPYHSPLF